MQLEEIFSHDDNLLMRIAARHVRLYQQLRQRFEAFEECIRKPYYASFPHDGSYTFMEKDIKRPHVFRIESCGMRLEFLFDMTNDDRFPGLVTCVGRSIHNGFEPKEIGRFGFGEGGYTNIDPKNAGPLKMDDADTATAILMSFIIAASAIDKTPVKP